jgi:carbon storage regulator
MLILTRRLGERIMVPGCQLTITVCAIQGRSVRLGISAPAEVQVLREELWQQRGLETAGCSTATDVRHTEG